LDCGKFEEVEGGRSGACEGGGASLVELLTVRFDVVAGLDVQLLGAGGYLCHWMAEGRGIMEDRRVRVWEEEC